MKRLNILGASALLALAALAAPAGAQQACVGYWPPAPGYVQFVALGTLIYYPDVAPSGAITVVLDTDQGGTFDVVNVVCGSSIAADCLDLAPGDRVTLSGRVLPQECPVVIPSPQPTQRVRLRAEGIVKH